MNRLKGLALAAAASLALQPTLASAQANCVTEQEVTAIAIYAVPGAIEAVRLKCGATLGTGGYLARSGAGLSARYTALQPRVWPRAKAGLLKVLTARAGDNRARQSMGMMASLPDSAVRPLVDALIVQEISAKIATGQCRRIELVLQAIAPIEPEIAGGVIGSIVGLVDPEQMPVCPRRA